MKCCMFDKIDDPKKKSLNDKIDAVGWGLFFIMIGVLLLAPEGNVPETAWLVGAGLILLGGNAARRLNNIKMCGCTVFLGIIALVAGIAGLYGVTLPIFPIILIIIGGSIIFKLIAEKK